MPTGAWLENLSNYTPDIYCVIGAAASLLAVFISWWMTPRVLEANKEQHELRENLHRNAQGIGNMSEEELKLRFLKPCKLGLTAILDQVEQSLTSDQLEQERQIERLQLENIFKMVSEQQEKFQIGSIEELEDQMKLYKR